MQRSHTWLAAVALIVATLVAYSPAYDAGFVWDDQDYVVENSNLVRPDGLRRIWFAPRGMVQYYPLVHTVLWAEYRLWQLQPAGYHAVNIVLHAVNAWILWRLLLYLAVPGAWFIAAVFALHPLQVESVAWITELKNVLSALFYLLAVSVFLRFRAARARDGGPRAPWRQRPRVLYTAALVLFTLAVLSKTTVVTLPIVLLLLVWWKTGRIQRDDWLQMAPLFAIAVGLGAFTWWLETFHVGSEKVLVLSLWERLLLPGRVLWFYAAKIVWPQNLIFIYPRWHVDPTAWWQFLLPLTALAAIVMLWRQQARIGRGPLAAVLFFAVTLAPVSGVLPFYFQLYSFVGDHFQYLAGIGVVTLVVAPLVRWTRAGAGTQQEGGLWRIAANPVIARGLPAAILVVLAIMTWSRARVFRSEESLWRDTLAKNEAAWIAHNNLGVIAMRQGRKDEAATHFAATVAARPNAPEARANLGILYQERGDTQRAIAEYRQAVAINPALSDAQYNLGVLLAQRGELDEAARCFAAVIEHRPRMADAHMRLGDVLATQGQFDAAIAKYRDALAWAPNQASVHYRMGWALASQEAFAAARAPLTESLRLQPADAETHSLLGWVLERLGDRAGAERHYREALKVLPEMQSAREGLARVTTPAP